jgi:ABC-type bacteriocin/lantibiotic exporter with double-glycine peptidase domain
MGFWGGLLASAALSVPFVAQRGNTCAAASLSMVLRYWDVQVTEGEVAAALLEPRLHGIPGSALEAFAKARGLKAVAYAGDMPQLRDYVGKGRPLIVAWGLPHHEFHNVVVVGFGDNGEVIVNDPAAGAARRVSAGDFERRWSAAGHWTLLVLPADP